jgi:hypothetical protein
MNRAKLLPEDRDYNTERMLLCHILLIDGQVEHDVSNPRTVRLCQKTKNQNEELKTYDSV